MRIIKRYSNRKLYDTKERHYVTLPAVAEMERKGDEIQVLEYETNRDITAATLAQIIFEEEKRGPRLGVDFLRGIILNGLHGSGPAGSST